MSIVTQGYGGNGIVTQGYGGRSIAMPVTISPFKADIENVSSFNEVENILRVTQLENQSIFNELQLVKT